MFILDVKRGKHKTAFQAQKGTWTFKKETVRQKQRGVGLRTAVVFRKSILDCCCRASGKAGNRNPEQQREWEQEAEPEPETATEQGQ